MFGKRKRDVHAGISSPDRRQEVSPRNEGTQSAKDAYGEGDVLSSLETSRQDLFFAVRQLSKNLGFTFTAIAVFALGVAASTVIFAFVDAALVKPLPYRDPSRLVALYERIPVGDRYHISWGDYLDWKRLNRAFLSLDVYASDLLTLKSASSVEEVAGVWVSDGFFRTLGVEPFLGRDFRPGEDQPSAQQTVLLSYENWQRRFSASKGVLGQTLTLDGVPSLIIGVLPPGFHFAPVGAADYWLPLHWVPQGDIRTGHPYLGVGRLKQGISVATAYADLSAIAQQIAVAYPRSNRDRSAVVIPLVDAIVGDIRPTLVALLAGAGLLSLVGFVNVSSLLLVRTENRRREIAVRSALGASRGRLIYQFAVEGYLLAGSGCCIGLLLAYCAVSLLPGLIPPRLLDNMPYLQHLHLNAHIVLFALMISTVGGILFSAAPALQLFLSDTLAGLRDGGRTVSRSWRKMGSGLVAAELAITVVLLVSALLLAKSFYRLLHEDIGISADHLAVLHVLDPDASTDAQQISTDQQVLHRIRALPGVTSVGTSNELAVDDGERFKFSFEHFRVAGKSYIGEGDEASRRSVSVGYFETLRAGLLQGRFFAEGDDATKPLVAVINRTMAKQAFFGEDPLGKSIVSEYYKDNPLKVIGIVDDIKDGPLDRKQTAAVYTSLKQNPSNNLFVTLRTFQSEETVLPTIVRAVHQINPGLIIDGQDTMANRINSSQSAYLHRSAAWIVAAFAALALLLGTVGLYGVISYSVSQRTREIGVRMALGAQRSGVYGLILAEACWLATLGIAGGVLCSFATAGLLRRMLFGVSPWDMTTLLSVGCLLTASALVASFIPARRAASLNPTEAMRAE